jgi:hypothetical protein
MPRTASTGSASEPEGRERGWTACAALLKPAGPDLVNVALQVWLDFRAQGAFMGGSIPGRAACCRTGSRDRPWDGARSAAHSCASAGAVRSASPCERNWSTLMSFQQRNCLSAGRPNSWAMSPELACSDQAPPPARSLMSNTSGPCTRRSSPTLVICLTAGAEDLELSSDDD